MTYKTLKGYTYVVTASEAVTITDSNGLVLEVPAGEQRPFTASTTEVEYSAPCTITQVRGNFNMPSAGGGGGGQPVAPVPEPLGTTTTLKQGHVYLVTADATAQDFTGITLADNATAEIWLTCTSDDNSVALPGSTEGWIWLDAMPDMAAGKTYAVAARNVGNAVLARPIYEYTTPAAP